MGWNLVGRVATSRTPALIAAALWLVVLGGCVHHHHHEAASPSVHARGHGPPPHAPAHGYRHKRHRDGVELVFDSGLGVYVVVETPGLYWHADRYLRWSRGHWRASSRIDGGWVVVASDAVPATLVRRHARHHKKHKSRGKGAWPARHGD